MRKITLPPFGTPSRGIIKIDFYFYILSSNLHPKTKGEKTGRKIAYKYDKNFTEGEVKGN
jgi:hypothetical protein